MTFIKLRQGVITIYSSFDYESGLGPRLYRSPAEIKYDIDTVARKLEDINKMLNVRHVISEYALCVDGTPIKQRAAGMLELCESAGEVLDELRELNESLDDLTQELVWTLQNT